MKEVVIKSKIVGKVGATGGGKPVAFPDLSAYALRSDFLRLESSFNEFLEGDDTDNVINRWKELEAFLDNISEDYNLLAMLNGKADKATTLSGYGITDAYTKTNVDDLLKAYVTLSGTQTITGEKNFTGGLKVNGSPIYYDTDKKYWKLEGDLLVTGGITMYGNEGTYTPSTIMDAIAVDGTTISKSGGVLKVIGGTGGGSIEGLSSVAYSGKYDDLIGKPTLLSSFTDDVVSGKYLPLSGGTLSSSSRSPLTLKSGSSENHSLLLFNRGNDYWGSIGFNGANSLIFKDTNGANYTIWHSGNDGSGSGLDADLLDGRQPSELNVGSADVLAKSFSENINYGTYHSALKLIYNTQNDNYGFPNFYVSGLSVMAGYTGWQLMSYGGDVENPYFRSLQDTGAWKPWRQIAFLTDNVASATKLQTARTIWGQSFDGSGNVSGVISGVNGISFTSSNAIDIDYNSNFVFKYTHLQDWSIQKQNTTKIFMVRNDGKVGIGTATPKSRLSAYAGVGERPTLGDLGQINTVEIGTAGEYGTYFWTEGSGSGFIQQGRTDGNATAYNLNLQVLGGNVGIGTASPQQKLHVEGHVWANGDIAAKTKIHAFGNLIANGNAGIGTESPSAKLHIVNNANTSTGLRLDGGWSGYGFLYNAINIFLNGEHYGGIGVNTVSSAYGSTSAAGTYITNAKSGEYMNFYNEGGVFLKSSLLVNGGITMYSDQRKKTILNHVELSIKQIAEAPLIEHYYNSDDKKTNHVGSIAQYWASMNDWFCKLDSEGFYTMEIQNAALASAISIARELDRYETKTDKAIKKLKKRICELEEEVERLRAS